MSWDNFKVMHDYFCCSTPSGLSAKVLATIQAKLKFFQMLVAH
ncbi:hypothetical protein [Cronobacter sakazakii]|nr:hypothetical protein [Cronobacter sakazakii]